MLKTSTLVFVFWIPRKKFPCFRFTGGSGRKHGKIFRSMLKSSLLVVGLNSSTLAVAMLSRWLLPISPTPNSPKPISPKPISPKIVFRSFRPFLVGVRLRRHRRVFAPHQDLFRPVDRTRKFQPEAELLQYLYKIFSKIIRISPFNLDFRPFPVGVRL